MELLGLYLMPPVEGGSTEIAPFEPQLIYWEPLEFSGACISCMYYIVCGRVVYVLCHNV
jgi:hypothetical protein